LTRKSLYILQTGNLRWEKYNGSQYGVLCFLCEQVNEVYKADLERNRHYLREDDAELEIGRLTRHINILQEDLSSEFAKNAQLREDLNELHQVRQAALSFLQASE
jgi:hypothetical protein